MTLIIVTVLFVIVVCISVEFFLFNLFFTPYLGLLIDAEYPIECSFTIWASITLFSPSFDAIVAELMATAVDNCFVYRLINTNRAYLFFIFFFSFAF